MFSGVLVSSASAGAPAAAPTASSGGEQQHQQSIAEVLAKVAKTRPGAQRSAAGEVSANADEVIVEIENVNSVKCFDVINGSGANGADVQQYECANVGQQRFRVLNPDQPWSSFQALHSGKCLDVRGGYLSNGTQLQQWDCTPGLPAQQFTLFNQSNGSVAIVPQTAWEANALRAKCLDVRGGATGNGAKIQQWECGTVRDDNEDVVVAQQFRLWLV